MSTPAKTQILDAIGARLSNIKTGNGYFTTLQKKTRAKTGPFQDGDLPACNYWPSGDELTEPGAGWEERRITVFVEYYVLNRDDPFTDVAAELEADVWVALWRDPTAPKLTDTPSPRLGNLVSGMRMVNSVPAIGEGQKPFCAALLELSITYKRQPDSPFTILT